VRASYATDNTDKTYATDITDNTDVKRGSWTPPSVFSVLSVAGLPVFGGRGSACSVTGFPRVLWPAHPWL